MNHIYSIYRARCVVNRKSYVGFDSNWPNRKIEHERDSFNQKKSYYNCLFHKGIRKHGTHNFEWSLVYQSLDSENTLRVMEAYFIQEYESFWENNGYNMTLGGEGTCGPRLKEDCFFCGVAFGNLGLHYDKCHLNPSIQQNCEVCGNPIKKNPHEIRVYCGRTCEGKSKKGIPQKSEHRIKRTLSMSHKWKIIFPDGKEEIILNLNQFCRDNNLNQGSMMYVANGERSHNKGFKCFRL